MICAVCKQDHPGTVTCDGQPAVLTDRDPDDIRIEPSGEPAEPKPCYVCGSPASDAVDTKRYRWSLCVTCVELIPLCLVSMRHAAAGENDWLEYAQTKLQRALNKTKERR